MADIFYLEDDEKIIVDYHQGVQVNAEELKQWRYELLKMLEEVNVSERTYYTYISSGNGIVFGIKDTLGNIQIIEVSTGYKKYQYKNHELT